MRLRMMSVVIGVMLSGTGVAAANEAMVGQPAPGFVVTDTNGRTQALSELRGNFVVLEWFNPECPFVKKHYGSGNIQSVQKEAMDQGVVWLSVDSSAPGKQGHVTAEEANAFMQAQGGSPTAIVLDPDGTLGRRYGARTTPHLFIIDPAGTLIYNGAIDDTPSTDPADVPAATNYVRQTLAEAMAGEPVSVPSIQPYGCSVKY
jgi:hypothetical protein